MQLVKPGQYVDLLFTPTDLPNYDESGGLIMTLFKGVKILAMNGVTTGGLRSSRGADRVTFELTPEQSNILLLAEAKGRLDITYTGDGKGDGVVGVDNENRATLNQILGIVPPADPDQKNAFTTEVFPGNQRQIRSFVDGKMTDRYLIEQQDYNPANDRNGIRSTPSGRVPPSGGSQNSNPLQPGDTNDQPSARSAGNLVPDPSATRIRTY